MSSAAQQDDRIESSPGLPGNGALRQIAAERLAAHRSRRAVPSRREAAAAQGVLRLQQDLGDLQPLAATRPGARPSTSRVREAVAARYRESVSYREFLATEAQRALEQAQAEAEVATRTARAVVEAQRQLLSELNELEELEQRHQPNQIRALETLPAPSHVEPPSSRPGSWTHEESAFASAAPAKLQVRLHEEFELPRAPAASANSSALREFAGPEELEGLDEEIAFRLAPEFGAMVLETQSIPGNIIEFPRELVATRKARPRLAEGPLREDGQPEPQLRIFEVGLEQISVEPELLVATGAPEWQGLFLGSNEVAGVRPALSPQLEAQLQLGHELYPPRLSRRVASGVVDGICLLSALAGFGWVALEVAGQPLSLSPQTWVPLPVLGVSAAGTLFTLFVLYKMLFFTLNEATPGMRAARLAFCTFGQESPSRRAIRQRLIATALAASPLGLGLLWMALDSDRLGWHDRISRMYPRKY